MFTAGVDCWDEPATGSAAPARVCRRTETTQQRRWSQANPAAGVMRTIRYESHTTSVLATLVRDSYGTPSLMVGGSYHWQVAKLGGLSVDAGLAGGLWYRSLLQVQTNQLPRRVVPFAFPSTSISHSETGLGLQLGVAPGVDMSIGGQRLRTTTSVMAQLSYRLSATPAP